ncbi:MAG: AAA family ATPase [Alphaproteobacteria bacterium]|nr:AAA family ATPase [Alphaproteobacteria bacterium]
MAFAKDEASVDVLRAWAGRQGFPSDSVQSGGADLFAVMLESEAPPKLVFVDVDNQDQPVQVLARLVGLCGTGTHLIAIGSANDIGLYRAMQAAGAADYLVKPLTPEMLTQAMSLAMRNRGAAGGTVKETKVIVVLGVRGGVGASTIATNIGWLFAHEMKQKCALIDLDLQFGTSALALDLEPGHGLREIVSSPQRVDSLMVSGAVVNESDNFSVLSAEESIEELVHVDNAAVSMLLREMRVNYRVLIIDMPRHQVPAQKRLFALAHEIILVTEMSLAGIRDTLRVRSALKTMGVAARVTLVANRNGPQRSTGIDEATFAKGAQAKIDFFLPDDPKNVAAASNAGKTLGAVAKAAPLTKTLLQLSVHLMGPAVVVAGKGPQAKDARGGWFGGRKQAADGAS